MSSQVEREIKLTLMMNPEEVIKFHSENTPYVGIFSDDGLDTIAKIDDWQSVKGLDKINDTLNKLDIRSRFNSHRNCEVFICWLSNSINIDNYSAIEAQNIIKKHAKFC